MIEFVVRGIKCRVSPLFPALVALLLFEQTADVALACLLASLIHELGHVLAMCMLGMPPKECALGLFGLRLQLRQATLSYEKYLFVAAAGPLVNGLVASALWLLDRPQTVWVHLLLALLNILPVSALDGGEILRCVFGTLGWQTIVERVLTVTSVISVLALSTVGVVAFVMGEGNGTLILFGMYPAVLMFLEKFAKTP